MRRFVILRVPFRILAIPAVLAVGAAGCGGGDGLPRQSVSGDVTFDGKPLDKAWIEFQPAGGEGVTTAAAMINGGSYYVPRADGLIPGTYRVSISKVEAPEEDEPEPEPEPKSRSSNPSALKKGVKAAKLRRLMVELPRFAKQLIPDRYNTKSKLTLEVKPDQTNDFDFELTTK